MHVVLGENFGKAGVLREKAVARMDGVGAGDLAGGEQRRDIEIAVLARRGGPMQTLSSASRTCMASASAVECTATVGMPSSLQARRYPQRDLTSVGDQDLIEHLGLKGE